MTIRIPPGFRVNMSKYAKTVRKRKRPDLKNKRLSAAHKRAIQKGLLKFHRTGKAKTFSFTDARGREHTVQRHKPGIRQSSPRVK